MNHDAATLEAIIRNKDLKTCLEFFLGTTTEERAALRPLVEELTPWVIQAEKDSFKAMFEKTTVISAAVSVLSSLTGSANPRIKALERCKVIGACVLVTGTLAQMKKLDFKCDPFGEPELLCQLLKHAPVSWLHDWIEHQAATRKRNNFQFLIKAGLCEAPQEHNEEYILGFFDHWHRRNIDVISSDPEFLRTHVWRFFEVEGGGDRSLATYDKYNKKPEYTWTSILKKLSEEGKLPRVRLLDASLEALARDFAQFRAGWYSRFHEEMAPTLEERVERMDAYLKLLTSSIPPTVAFALEALKLVQQAGRLPAQRLLDHLAPALLLKSKSSVLTALALLENVAKDEPPLRANVLRVASEGLVSELVPVQERIAKLMAKYAADLDDETRERVAGLSDLLSPSVRKKMQDLPGLAASAALAESYSEAESAPVPALTPLDSSRAVIPIATPDELIERASFMLENATDLEETERVLDGLVRFASQGKALGKVAQPLLKRAAKIFETKKWLHDPEEVAVRFLSLLIRAWLDSKYETAQKEMARDDFFGRFLKDCDTNSSCFRRLLAIIGFVEAGQELPLLSTPTHRGFYLDPRTLVERLLQWQRAGREPEGYDIVIALHRVPVEHRAEAARHATALNGEVGQAVRYALGADEPIGSTDWLWVAASRSRYFGEDDPALLQKYPEFGPGAGAIPRNEFKPVIGIRKYKLFQDQEEQSFPFHELHAQDSETGPSKTDINPLCLAVTLCSFRQLFGTGPGMRHFRHVIPAYMNRHFLSVWPTWKEPIYAAGVMCLGNHSHWFDVDDHGSFILLEALAGPFEPWHIHARYLLNFGLSCPHADGRSAAVNAFIVGIDSGRLDPTLLGQAMHEFFASGLILPARVRKSLDEVVRISPRHRRAVLAYLRAILRGDSSKAPDHTAKLLELYHELLVEHGEQVLEPEGIAYLQAFPGGGQGPKIARKILQLK